MAQDQPSPLTDGQRTSVRRRISLAGDVRERHSNSLQKSDQRHRDGCGILIWAWPINPQMPTSRIHTIG